MILSTFTFVHVVISLVAIASGLVVMFGLVTAKRLDFWTGLYLLTTVLTSVTGFFFPVDHFTPAHAFAILSLVLLSVAIFARYIRHLAGAWRTTYVITAVISLYLNVFVLIVQSFQKIPNLAALAPTQSEPPFLVSQLVVLAAFFALGIVAAIRFRHEKSPVAAFALSK
jgi:hypothetical protein